MARTDSSVPRPGPRKKGSPTPADGSRVSATIQNLLDTAEQLFADKGVDHVSLRQIVQASEQKNAAALQYHFGSRAQLVTEVLQRRRAHVNTTRHAYLDALEHTGAPMTVRDVIGASTHALSDTVVDTPWGWRYVSILEQTTSSPQLRADGVTLTEISGVKRAHMLIARALPELPLVTLQRRQAWFSQTVVYSLGHWIRTHEPGSWQGYAAYVEDLVDYCVGGLQAPMRDPGLPIPPPD